jgi:hypothetical protein
MLNFNVSPYYDDFDPTKNYHRILFKPGYAVQARELTQSQSILQNQISNFADNIFSQNTPVSGGKVTTNLKSYYIRLNLTVNNVPVVASSFLGKIITDTTGTVQAKVIATAEATGTSINPGDPPTLIVSYLSGVQFVDGNSVYPTDGTNITATVSTSTSTTPSTGLSSVASISSGVFYIVNGYSQSSTANADGSYTNYSIGNFVQVNPQTIILSKYTNSPSARIGLEITETIVDYVNDTSLLDPAVGASNYQAPGADRYQINLTLTSLPIQLGNDGAFIELVRVVGGQIVMQTDQTVYSTIDDYFAKRDYETNGDYIVNDFKLTPSANALGVSAQYDLSVGKGVAYVHGYRIENQSAITLTSDRARQVNEITGNDIYIDYGNYFVVDTSNGVFDVTTVPSVDMHCVPAANVVSTNNVTYSSTLVGSSRIRGLQYVTGTGSNTQSYVYNAYLSDIATNTLSGNTSSATSNTLTINDTNGSFSNVANAYYNCTLVITSGTDVGDTRNIVSYANKVITVSEPFTVTPDSTTKFSILFQTTDIESIVEKSASYGVNASLNINTTYGKVDGLTTGDAVLNSPGTPELIFPVGSPYVANISNTSYVSTKVFRNKTFTSTGLTLTINSGPIRFITDGHAPLGTSTVLNNFMVVDTNTGHILDFTSSGNTVNVATGSQQVTFSSSSYNGKVVDVICKVNVTSGDASGANNAGTILKSKNLVLGNTSIVSTAGPSSSGAINGTTYVDLANGQTYIVNSGTGTNSISLYVTDVKRVKKIIDTGAPGVVPTVAMLTSSQYDVTNQYVLSNGQKDNYYDHASIQTIAGANAAKGNLLVIYDFYTHSGGDGYFSVLSYLAPSAGGVSSSPEVYAQIPTYTATDGIVYRLSDSLDFRPVRKSATSVFSTYSGNDLQTNLEYTGTPSTDDTGVLIPVNGTQFASNYGYYQGRSDLLILSKDKSFQIIEGTPADIPLPPAQPDGTLLLANLTLDPYTAYVPGENPGGSSNLSVNKVPHQRWAKSDITDLQTRVNNLEYYTSLSILEQNAQSLQVPDVNGLNRFKNGILVDDFSSYSTADTINKDYAANINIRKQQLSPVTIVENLQLQNPIVAASLGTISNTNTWAVSSIQGTQTNVFTLPYTPTPAIIQPLATSDVSLNPFSVVITQGVATLNPPMDNWVDNQQAPSILVTDPSMQIYQQTNGVNVTNAGDFATIPGTETSTTTTASYVSHNDAGVTAGGISPYGYVGFTATTTSTYASQLQNITTTGNFSPVSSSMSLTNGYLTNIAVLPYIRPQQIGFTVQGLLVNTPVKVFFDGVDVSQYITSPNTLELTNVSGTFNEDDVIGFYTENQFFPTGRVLSVYNYPSTSNVRLYISQVIGQPNWTTTNVVGNSVFDSNGNYISNTAFGTVNSGIQALHNSGQVTGVGGSYTPTSGGQASQIYAVQDPSNWGNFLNQYGVWGDLNRSANYTASFVVVPTVAGTYSYTWASTGTTTLTANGSNLVATSNPNYTGQSSGSFTITSGQLNSSFSIGWTVTNGNNTPASTSGIALLITDPSGNVVFTSTTPPVYSYDGVQQEIVMPEGGAWFTGVTQLALDQNANAPSNTYFLGAQISVTSKYVYQYTAETATYVPPPPAPSGGGGGGGGGKIICKKLAELGYFDKVMNDADQRFGIQLRDNDPRAYYGYLRWAQTVVDLMEGKGSEKLRKVVFFWEKDQQKRVEMQKNIVIYYMDMLARPWAEEMAFRMKAVGYNKSNPAGRMIMNIGLPLCRKVGKIQMNGNLPIAAKTLIIWGVVTVLLVSVISISGTNTILNKIKNIFKKKPQVQTINN